MANNARKDEILAAVNRIVEDSRVKFFAPWVTDAERAARVTRDLQTTYGGKNGENLMWPFKRVIESPFMFLDMETCVSYAGSAFAKEVVFAQARSLARPTYPRNFHYRGETIAVCAAAQRTSNWIADVADIPFLLTSHDILADPPEPLLSSGLRSVAELDAFYEQVSEVFCFNKVWFYNPFLIVENIPDEVVLRALSYLPIERSAFHLAHAIKLRGRSGLVETLMPGVVAAFPNLLHGSLRKRVVDMAAKMFRAMLRDDAFPVSTESLLTYYAADVFKNTATFLAETRDEEQEQTLRDIFLQPIEGATPSLAAFQTALFDTYMESRLRIGGIRLSDVLSSLSEKLT